MFDKKTLRCCHLYKFHITSVDGLALTGNKPLDIYQPYTVQYYHNTINFLQMFTKYMMFYKMFFVGSNSRFILSHCNDVFHIMSYSTVFKRHSTIFMGLVIQDPILP